MTLEEKTPGEIVTSQTVSFSDVVYGFVQEDYTEFTDFPSSEDLDAFLADMELDCENILQKTSLAPADVLRSADPFELQQKVEVSRTFGNLRTTTTTGSEIPCTAQTRLTNFVVVLSSTTPNTVEPRRPAVHKLRQVHLSVFKRFFKGFVFFPLVNPGILSFFF